jgi:hypothetical protein
VDLQGVRETGTLLELQSGWNLVAVPGGTRIPPSALITAIWYWDGQAYRQAPPGQSLPTQPTSGYWVLSPTGGTVTVPTPER